MTIRTRRAEIRISKKPCKQCGSLERYVRRNVCVQCEARRDRHRYAANQNGRAGALKIQRTYWPPKPDDGRCDCCLKVTRLVYDHDHETGEFRGWLCHGCNTALGKLGDDAKGVRNALEYLERKLIWQ